MCRIFATADPGSQRRLFFFLYLMVWASRLQWAALLRWCQWCRTTSFLSWVSVPFWLPEAQAVRAVRAVRPSTDRSFSPAQCLVEVLALAFILVGPTGEIRRSPQSCYPVPDRARDIVWGRTSEEVHSNICGLDGQTYCSLAALCALEVLKWSSM